MNALFFVLLAAVCASLSSLAFRKNTDSSVTNQSPNGYLILFYFSSFLLSFLYDPKIWNTNINFTILGIGACVGILSSSLMFLTSKALKQGPAGLIFAFQNASAIFPGLILFLLFGSNFGFSFTLMQLLGIALALFGLFWGARHASDTQYSSSASSTDNRQSIKWLKYTLLCFVVQISALTLIQARCLLFDAQQLGEFFSQLAITEADDVWFMPGLFGAALIIQVIIFFNENKKIQRNEMLYGLYGGFANFSSTCLLLIATKFAGPFEKVMIFPCFAITAMILCNIWANRIYKEKFNFATNFLCSCGIFMVAG